MKYKGIIFDLDGTLLDSLSDLCDSMNSVLLQHTFPLHEVETFKKLLGNGLKNLVSLSIPEEQRTERLVARCHKDMLELYGKNCTNKTVPYDGIPALLDALTERNVEMAVFSNKGEELAQHIVKSLLGDWSFNAVIGKTSDVLRKPNPQKALKIAQLFGLSSTEILFVGDSDIDIKTAHNAGMCSVAVSWGFRSRQELVDAGAKHIIDHPMELLGIL